MVWKMFYVSGITKILYLCLQKYLQYCFFFKARYVPHPFSGFAEIHIRNNSYSGQRDGKWCTSGITKLFISQNPRKSPTHRTSFKAQLKYVFGAFQPTAITNLITKNMINSMFAVIPGIFYLFSEWKRNNVHIFSPLPLKYWKQK